jgi:tRNA dimethylallyltransferase
MSSPEKSSLPLLVLVGPTAVGKTELSLLLAERLDGEIVSADARLFYRGLDIGTAKPSLAERRRVPHHLVDVAEPGETWSLAIFQEAARRAILSIHARGRLPILVGGSGQYIHAVTHGWSPPAVPPDPRLRRVLEALAGERGAGWLHAGLARIDPAAARQIDPRNLRRTVRALEVVLTSGQLFSGQRGQHTSPYRLLTIGLTRPRPELYTRLDARIEAMFAAGLLEEVKTLLEAGWSPNLPSLSSIGYRECAAVLESRMSEDQAKAEMRRRTRLFVRRQANWFKWNDPDIYWFEAGRLDLEAVVDLVEAFLKGA